MRTMMLTAVVATLGMGGAALAQQTTMATASTDLNLRAGPGVQYPITGVTAGGSEVSVLGCLETSNWCEVSSPAGNGWSFGDYLTVSLNDAIVPLYPNYTQVGVVAVAPPVIEEPVTEYTYLGRVTPPVWGAPVAVVPPYAPTTEVSTYVTSNVVEPIYVEGEVVTGAVLPEAVTLYDIPTYPDYRYVQVNGQTVLVEPTTREVVYVYR